MSDQTYSRLSPATRDWFSTSALSTYANANAYVDFLTNKGYATGTIDAYLRCVAHFAHWLALEQLALDDIHEATVTAFLDEHLPHCGCAKQCWRTKHCVRAALTHLLAMLRVEGLIERKTSTIPPPIKAELEAFDSYLADVRGLQVTTRHTQLRRVSAFLLDRFSDGKVRLNALSPLDIERFTESFTGRWKPASINCFCVSMRSYLRFKATQGINTSALITALPHTAQWRLSSLPRELPSSDIKMLLGAFDRTTATGRRDYAIARCYVDLGLRTIEVVRLQLDDVDWRGGTVQIRGKGCRIDKLPLPSTTAEAILDYLRAGRRRTQSRMLFLRHRPPLDKPATAATIRGAIRNAAQRCGLASRLTSTHLLRHTFACRLVSSGVSLKTIADLLRHRNLDTTTIYAKVDFEALTSVAAPWPGSEA